MTMSTGRKMENVKAYIEIAVKKINFKNINRSMI